MERNFSSTRKETAENKRERKDISKRFHQEFLLLRYTKEEKEVKRKKKIHVKRKEVKSRQ